MSTIAGYHLIARSPIIKYSTTLQRFTRKGTTAAEDRGGDEKEPQTKSCTVLIKCPATQPKKAVPTN